VAVRGFDGVDGADAGMIQGGSTSGLKHEAIEDGGFAGQLGRKKLQGYAAAQGEVFGFVNDSHPAAAELAEDAVMRDGLADHACGIILIYLREGGPNGLVAGARHFLAGRPHLSRRTAAYGGAPKKNAPGPLRDARREMSD
jgi:hypothetical protein